MVLLILGEEGELGGGLRAAACWLTPLVEVVGDRGADVIDDFAR